MADKTGIEWTDASWNPLRGCSRVSEGCRNCYAEAVAGRFSGPGQPYEGLVKKTKSGPRWNGTIKLVPEHLDDPLRWRKPRKVFVNSMSDLFHEGVPFEYIDRVWAVMLLSPRHTFQILTKRPARMLEYFARVDLYDRVLAAANELRGRLPHRWQGVGISDPATMPAPWIWLGTSTEDQTSAETRIPLLLECPAAVRWISAEPLLGPLDLSRKIGTGSRCADCGDGVRVDEDGCCVHCGRDALWYGVDWIVIGGESGPGARPMDLEWVRGIIEQCARAHIPVFVKQLGSIWARESGAHHAKGGDMAEWPEALRVRQWPAQAEEGVP